METKQEKTTPYATPEEIRQIKKQVGHIFDIDSRSNLTLKSHFNIPTFKMIFVRGGDFMMGDGKEYSDKPHPVELTYNFFVGQYPVTQEIYKAVTGKTPSDFHGINHPVEQVSWKEAMDFCNVLNEKIGYSPVCNDNYDMLNPQGKPTEDITQVSGFRLPTESEWEYAAASTASTSSAASAASGAAAMIPGTTPVAELVEATGGGQVGEANTPYPGSNHLDEVGWYIGNNNYETKPVGLKFPNQPGLYDMSGNVWEWCLDWYDETFYKEGSKQIDPANLGKGSDRVLRGGAWRSNAGNCRAASRGNLDPDRRWHIVGFRLLFALQFTT